MEQLGSVPYTAKTWSGHFSSSIPEDPRTRLMSIAADSGGETQTESKHQDISKLILLSNTLPPHRMLY